MQTHSKQQAIDENLFNWPAENPALRATQCNDCGSMVFPVNGSCKACGSRDVNHVELPTRGKLWTWTVQRFMPKEPYNSSETPETFKPFGVGYIDLPGVIRIEARLMGDDFDSLEVGTEMELGFYTHRTEEDGTEIINYAFKPV